MTICSVRDDEFRFLMVLLYYIQIMIRKPNNATGQRWRCINSMIDTTSYLSYQKFKLLHMRMSNYTHLRIFDRQ